MRQKPARTGHTVHTFVNTVHDRKTEEGRVGTPHSDDPTTPAPAPTGGADNLARAHAASLSIVARERLWLLDALTRGEDINKLAAQLHVTPRAIRHLLGDVAP